MRLNGQPYKLEEELSDTELDLRLENIHQEELKILEILDDPRASAEQKRATLQLRSNEVSYFHLLRWIGRAEITKRRCSRDLITKQTKLEAGHLTESDRRIQYLEVEILQKSIDAAISTTVGHRAYIKEHEDEIDNWLTAIGLSADDDLRPAGVIERGSRSKGLIADVAKDREEPSETREIKSEKGRNSKKGSKLGDTDPSTCDLVTNPPPCIIVEGKKYHFQSYRYADGIDFTFEQAQAVALRYHYGIKEDSVCGRFLGIAHSSFQDRIIGADKKMIDASR
jgi:hypothetical protein